jgi:cytochrome c553
LGKLAILAASGASVFVLALHGPARADDARMKALGRHLAGECTSCHRIDGVDNGVPSITGWAADDFVTTMKYYSSGARDNPVMKSVAGSLDDTQLAALAAYFAALDKPPKKP